MKIAVLIHGCYLQAEGWENIIWGDPASGIFGRVSKGLQVARQEGANFIYWGTGASEKNDVKESQYTFDYAVAHCKELSEFVDLNTDDIESFFISGSFIDFESQNTKEEVSRCMELCLEKSINKLKLVSSPDHVPRAHKYAMDLRSARWEDFKDLCISAEGSDVRFTGSEPGDVLIVEPQHRIDRAKIPLHKTLKLAMFARKLDDEKAFKFNDELVAFLEEQRQKYLG